MFVLVVGSKYFEEIYLTCWKVCLPIYFHLYNSVKVKWFHSDERCSYPSPHPVAEQGEKETRAVSAVVLLYPVLLGVPAAVDTFGDTLQPEVQIVYEK